MKIGVDPRGPIVKILTVETSAGPTVLTLSCGHRVERVNHFSYRVGDNQHCFTCRKRDDVRNQHERFVRDAIARSLLTLPFANESAEVGEMRDYHKQLLECATTGELPPSRVLSWLVATIMADAALHKAAGNYLKAEIEETWCAGLQLHFTWGQSLVTP